MTAAVTRSADTDNSSAVGSRPGRGSLTKPVFFFYLCRIQVPHVL